MNATNPIAKTAMEIFANQLADLRICRLHGQNVRKQLIALQQTSNDIVKSVPSNCQRRVRRQLVDLIEKVLAHPEEEIGANLAIDIELIETE